MLFLLLAGTDTLLGLHGDIAFLAPSPASQALAAVTQDGVLYILSEDNGVQRVTDSVVAWGVSWSPDGSRLAFIRAGRIAVASGTKLSWQSQRFARPGYPAWLKDELVYTGDGFLFVGDKRFPGFSLVATVSPNPLTGRVAYTDIEGRFLLEFDPATGETDTLFSDPERLALFGPIWSPDGTRLLVSRAGPGFWLWDFESGAQRLISPGEAPSWSPDGKRVVYQVSRDDGHVILSSEIYILDVFSGTSDKLPGRQDRLSPKFGKEGIYYLSIGGEAGVFRMD
ncbi:MAG: hypothetical protein ABIM46_02300 [candidate division WOR-3 bacterium]